MNTNFKIQELIAQEKQRQQHTLQMIPSENYASAAVLAACGSVLNNKYAEGYPGKRYYQGNVYADEIETIAIDRAKTLFGAEHANVQPLSGAPANIAVYTALLQPGDTVLGMDLSHGGHLTHGSPVSISGKMYRFIHYGVEPSSEILDMEKIRKIALKEKPKLILSGFTAYPRTIDFQAFHDIAQEVGAYSMADISHIAGLIIAKGHPSPFPFTDVVTTTTHKTLRGPRSAIILCKKELAGKIDKAVFPGLQGGPHMHTIAAKAICFEEALEPEFSAYARQIIKNTKALAETLLREGIKLVSNGTDNHLILIDLLQTKSIAKAGLGRLIAVSLEEAGIVTNANTIPFDPSTPFNPSGIRLGTAALTTRGMGEAEMNEIGTMIATVIQNHDNSAVKEAIKQKIHELCSAFPIYN
ncbi:MAG TPA: serine hydroxymethyltransferase [Candidatus Nanoarchaeia archaeon]|nr:serine hydroxymethyltransferase [Candidatus Nanoarchaeia archaeon]